MLRGYRLAIIALGLTLFVDVVGLEAQPVPQQKPIVGVEQEQEGPAESESETGAQDRKPGEIGSGGSRPVASETKETIESEAVAAEHSNYPNCEFNDVQQCDLAAQQSMAESTRWMNYAAWVAAFLTLCGVILLIGTLLYTKSAAVSAKRMVDQAVHTTNAAREAVTQAKAANRIADSAAKVAQEAFRETIISTDRAWIKIEIELHGPIVFSEGKITVQMRYYFKNVGRSPASRVQPLYCGLFPNVIEAANRADEIIQEGEFLGVIEGRLLGSVLFPDDPSLHCFATHEMSIDDFRAGITRLNALASEEFANVSTRNTGWPGGLVGVRYTLPGDKRFRYTFMPFAIKSPLEGSEGFDGSDCEVSPKFLLIESRIGAVHLT